MLYKYDVHYEWLHNDKNILHALTSHLKVFSKCI